MMKYRFVFGFVVMSCLVLLQACGGGQEEVAAPPRPVKTMIVKEYDIGQQWTFAGTAEDALETQLSFRVGGKIIAFPGEQIGRKFSKGAVIARLDPSDYELEYRQAKANLEQVRANYVRAKADMQRNTELYRRSVISRGELDQIEADFKSYEAQLSASAKQLDIARKHLSYTTLNAPFDGWIGEVQAQVHQNVASGQAVASFNAGREMKMYVAVPDTLIAQVHEGDKVEVRFDALPGTILFGKVMEVSVDSTASSTYPVKVYLDNKNRLLRSGMSGQVSFLGRESSGARYFVPPVAVLGKTDGTRSLWIVDPATSTVSSQTVTIGSLSEHGLEIVEGVKKGDIIVTRGVHHLKEGLKVRYSSRGTEG
ncbi:efflux RND transporter periplasmic adaptor subunit [Pseudodesulfovibrio piezophilus]|uniref:Efflux transporter, RND family, MFP subunit n=1 Tax=Pseudodesulfovibrio piezophilus (strain DSM 21447 / JCM 15486 / C1TLV30) TaxID=1322246 RepID=M1WN25_PSEP2|nr:efflux RND transporter periplasmic adaptor subunit [Pseudodesulfovibrio piezophilus]CCH50125.1 Efflux transporter, RND family, MFP subunit [Pseudodesulfovibrio piezophilus C1TLV30]